MWCHSTAGPRSLARSGSSFHELHLSYRVRTAPNLPHTLPCRAPSLGFRSPSRHQSEEFTCERASQISPYGPPTAFLTLSTACSSSNLAGLFHPAATSGIHLPGVFSRCLAEPPHRRPVPSCCSTTRSCRRVTPSAPDRAAPPSGLCSGQRFEATDRVISPADASIPS
jgi:hypothetical protein